LQLIEFILHIDKYLVTFTGEFEVLVYGILFLIVFLETGFVITPFLPGDSLLFAAGAIAAQGSLNVALLTVIFAAASIFGDTVNYWLGFYVGPRAFTEGSRFFKKKYLDDAHSFYLKHGRKTIVLARFVPIIRTFAPFVAGIAKMSYTEFIAFNVTGAILWVIPFTWAGYFFGNVGIVKDNFSAMILVIVFVSILPGVWRYCTIKLKK
jgi:membrane-associated protein